MVSKQPRKQRKMRYNAPLHKRQKLVSVHVSKELRAKLKRRSMPVRKGDRVKVMRGKHKGKTGKVTSVDLNALKVYMEGVVARKAKGTEVPAPLEPSNLLLVEADLSDKRREELVLRSSKKGE